MTVAIVVYKGLIPVVGRILTVSRVQEFFAENGSQPAVFNIDKLTVFEVIVKDANATDLERSCYELCTNLETYGEAYVDIF